MTTNNLTEKWKKGELEQGWYYVSRNNDIEMLEYVGDYFLSVDVPLIDDKDVSTLEVLEPVPSYKEWQELSKQRNQLIRDVKDLAYIQEQNQQLKELLLKCREKLDELDYGCEVWQGELTGFIEEIDEVLK